MLTSKLNVDPLQSSVVDEEATQIILGIVTAQPQVKSTVKGHIYATSTVDTLSQLDTGNSDHVPTITIVASIVPVVLVLLAMVIAFVMYVMRRSRVK